MTFSLFNWSKAWLASTSRSSMSGHCPPSLSPSPPARSARYQCKVSVQGVSARYQYKLFYLSYCLNYKLPLLFVVAVGHDIFLQSLFFCITPIFNTLYLYLNLYCVSSINAYRGSNGESWFENISQKVVGIIEFTTFIYYNPNELCKIQMWKIPL